jgi:alkylation response protein AidB-like acyl-CoA dehydrogenase
MFQKMAREFAQRELLPVAQEYDKPGKYPYDIYKKMAPLGLLATMIPEKYGGAGLDHLSYGLICEELARDPRIELKDSADPISDIRNGAIDLTGRI